MHLTLRRPLGRPWAVSSQQRSRRNAMVAATALTQRRAERHEVEDYLAARVRDVPDGRRRVALTPWRAASARHRLPAHPVPRSRLRPLRHNRRHGLPCRIPHRVPDDPRPARLRRRALRRRHPPAGLDQRPRRHRSTGRPSCCATASAPARGRGRRCSTPTAASGSSAGTTAAPAARTRPADPQPGRHRRVRRGRAVGDGPLRRRPHRPHGLVDGRQHDVRAGHRATPSGSAGLFAVAGVPGGTFATMLGPFHLPARRRRRAHRQPGPAAAVRRPGADPDHPPAAGRAVDDRGPRPHRLHVPGARPRARGDRRSASSCRRRSTGTSTSRSAPPSTPGSGSARSACRPASSRRRGTSSAAPATCSPPPSGSTTRRTSS